MPIFKELSNLHLFTFWKSTSGASTAKGVSMGMEAARVMPEPGEWVRRVSEHFISFIHKLD